MLVGYSSSEEEEEEECVRNKRSCVRSQEEEEQEGHGCSTRKRHKTEEPAPETRKNPNTMWTKRSAPTMVPEEAPKGKRTRKMLTIAEKVELLDMLKEGRSCAAAGRHYGINESTVRSIKKEENNIRTTAAITFNKDAKRVATVRNKTIVRMESALALWINDCRKKNITLDNIVIRTKAKQLYETFADVDHIQAIKQEEDLGPSTSAVHVVSSPFYASKGWYEKFQKRFGLKHVFVHGEAACANLAGAEAFVNNTFKAIIEEGGYKPEQVFNMDETDLFWKQMPSRTFIMQEEAKAPGFKAQNDRLTLLLCGNAAGFMIKPGLIYKSKNPRALKNNNKDALPVHWMHNAKAWRTKELNLDWFNQCFIPEVRRYLSGKGLDFKVLLLVDNTGGHADDLSFDGVRIEFLPPDTRSLIQPLDQGIIRAFKALYTRNTLQQLVESMESDEDLSLKDYWRGYTIASCLQNIHRAIQEMKSETLNACWIKLWPEVVPDLTGGSADEVHHSAVDAAVDLAKQLGGDGFNDMTPDDINGLFNAYTRPLSDEDLAEMTKPPSEDEDEGQGEDEDARVDEDAEDGLTVSRLSSMVRMASELQRAAQEWDPLMRRSLQFSNIIEGGMSVYKNLLAQKIRERELLPLTMFFSRKSKPAPQPSVEREATAEQSGNKEAESEEL